MRNQSVLFFCCFFLFSIAHSISMQSFSLPRDLAIALINQAYSHPQAAIGGCVIGVSILLPITGISFFLLHRKQNKRLYKLESAFETFKTSQATLCQKLISKCKEEKKRLRSLEEKTDSFQTIYFQKLSEVLEEKLSTLSNSFISGQQTIKQEVIDEQQARIASFGHLLNQFKVLTTTILPKVLEYLTRIAQTIPANPRVADI
jgi:alanyl-tRNA synthetase